MTRDVADDWDNKKPKNCGYIKCVRSRVVGFSKDEAGNGNFGRFRARCAYQCGNYEDYGIVDPNKPTEVRKFNCYNYEETKCKDCLVNGKTNEANGGVTDNVCQNLDDDAYELMIDFLKRNKGDDTCPVYYPPTP